MFRVKQSQSLPRQLSGVLSHISTQFADAALMSERAAVVPMRAQSSASPALRRRRARRLAAGSGGAIRSTWF